LAQPPSRLSPSTSPSTSLHASFLEFSSYHEEFHPLLRFGDLRFHHAQLRLKLAQEAKAPRSSSIKNCEVVQAKVKYLMKTSSKQALGTTNLNVLLGSQNCLFDKAEIGYKPMFEKKTKRFSSFFKHISQHISPF